VAWTGWRLFPRRDDEPRSRRASDALLLGGATLGGLVLGAVAAPPAGFELAIKRFVGSVPSGLDGVWELLVDVFGMFALALVVAVVVRRRWAVGRDVVLSIVSAIGASHLLSRMVLGAWPAVFSSLRATAPSDYFSPLRLLLPAVVVMAASPHLSQSGRLLGRWLVAVGFLATVLAAGASPTGAAAAVLMAAASAAAIHLVFGSPEGRPSLDDIADALAALGIEARRLAIARRQRAGVFVVDADDGGGGRVVVKVYGRDAHDTQLVTTAWRTIWYREAGAPAVPGRLQQAEHEAFLTLLARQGGVVTDTILAARATARGDVVLVLRPVGRSLASRAEPWSAADVDGVWDVLHRLHGIGIVHGQIDDRHLIVDTGTIGVADFRGGRVARDEERVRVDEAQALVTTALGVGIEPALHAAAAALGPDGLTAALPYVQPAALTAHARREARASALDLDELRERAAAAVGAEAPELQQLRRVTWRSALQPVLLVLAFLALSAAFAGLDLHDLWTQVQHAAWWFIILGFLLAQTTRFAQSVSTVGASPTPLPLGPVYALQLATSYIAIAVPSYAARIAVNIRFFQRHGLRPGAALAIGGLDAVGQFVSQAALLGGLLLLTPLALELNLDGAAPTGLIRLVAVVMAAGLIAAAVVIVVPRLRRAVWGRVRELLTEARLVTRVLRSPRQLTMLLGGNIANEVLFAAALWAFIRSLGFEIGLSELLVINISVSLLSGLIPVPGGIGVVEGGLTFGLVRAGLPEETAFAAVLMYRLSSFYLPPIWGFFALRWLERNKYL
jgi:glycosyltransferase 2 family protein